MSKQTSKFKAAIQKAKKLYKTGRYNNFSDAVKAAYKSPGKKVGATKFIEKGEKKSTKAKVYRRVRTKKGAFKKTQSVSSIGNASAAALTGELIKRKKESLGKALLRREMATRKTDRRAISKQIAGIKKQIGKLS